MPGDIGMARGLLEPREVLRCPLGVLLNLPGCSRTWWGIAAAGRGFVTTEGCCAPAGGVREPGRG